MKDKRMATRYLCYGKVIFDPVNYGVIPTGGEIKGRKQMTKAQKWAKQRNFAKFRLAGVRENLRMLTSSDVLLSTEKKEVKRAIIFLDETIGSWRTRNGMSKKKFMEGGK